MASSHRVSTTSLGVAAFSTVVEWYDFTLYLYFSTVLARVFFGGGEAALVTTLMGFALAYLMRPVGAAVFGHIGDRHGRRPMLLISMAIMSLAMLGTALLPTYGQIGIAAAWLLFALRCVMGFSVGGEYTGVIAYLLEGANPRRRGLIASLAAAASEVGALLAVGVAALTVSLTSEAQLASWGWRVPFLVGAVLAGGVWFARRSMEESPEWTALHQADALHANPLGHAVTRQRAALLRAFAISALGSITYYVGITYVPAFLGTTGTLGEERALWLSTAAAVAVIVVTPLVGLAVRPFRAQAGAGCPRLAQRGAADLAVHADGGRNRGRGARWRAGAGPRRRRHERGRRDRLRRAVQRGEPGERPRPRLYAGHCDIRRADTVAGASAGRTDRRAASARRDDCRRCRGGAAGVPDDA